MFSWNWRRLICSGSAGIGIALLFPQAASACQGCANNELSSIAPGLLAVYPIFWCWIVALWWQQGQFARKHPELRRADIPGNRVRIFWTWAGILNALAIVFLFPHSAALLLAVAWCAYLATTLAKALLTAVFGWKANPDRRQLVRTNLIAIGAFCCVMPVVHFWELRPAGVISRIKLQSAHGRLDHRIPQQLLSFGPTIVPLLVEALHQPGLAARDNYAGRSRAAFCLSRFRGPEAEAALKTLVDEIDPKETFEFRWERVVLCCYADLMGPKSVETLKRKYSTLDATRPETADQRVFILCALARAHSRDGMQFVFEHGDDFGAVMEDWGDHPSVWIAVGTLEALLDGRDASSLSDVPLCNLGRYPFRDYGMTQTGLDDREFSSDIREPRRVSEPDKVLKRWRQDRESSRLKWDRLLQNSVM